MSRKFSVQRFYLQGKHYLTLLLRIVLLGQIDVASILVYLRNTVFIYLILRRYNYLPVYLKTITSGKLNGAASRFLDAVLTPTFANISKSLAPFFCTIVAIYRPALTEVIPKFLKNFTFSASIISSPTVTEFFLLQWTRLSNKKIHLFEL